MNKDNINTSKQFPLLYSLRNCPFAMRARIAIFKAQQKVELRDVVLSNKPAAMLTASPKGTVPVLVLASGTQQETVIEESIDIMLWALTESDPSDLLQQQAPNALASIMALISTFDNEFKSALEAYKCAKRYREHNISECRQACERYIQLLENNLAQHRFLLFEQESLADIALLPFIRQFARVERQWYLQSPYPKLRQWLNSYLQSPMFTKVMAKYPLWTEDTENKAVVYFAG